MWVITSSVNDYNQYGDYFEGCFQNYPTLKELTEFFNDEKLAQNLLNGGGRIDFEGTWYHLTEMKSGERYTHS